MTVKKQLIRFTEEFLNMVRMKNKPQVTSGRFTEELEENDCQETN